MNLRHEILQTIRSEIELDRSQRLHVHDLLFRIIATYVVITTSTFAAIGHFLTLGGFSSPLGIDPRDAILAVITGLVALSYLVGLLHHIYCLNLRVNRDFHRQREQFLRAALNALIAGADAVALSAYESALKFSRGSPAFKFDRRWTSLFVGFGLLIDTGTLFLTVGYVWIVRSSRLTSPCLVSLLHPVVLGIVAIGIHRAIAYLYLKKYLSEHKEGPVDASISKSPVP